jgi:hypothetical protein
MKLNLEFKPEFHFNSLVFVMIAVFLSADKSYPPKRERQLQNILAKGLVAEMSDPASPEPSHHHMLVRTGFFLYFGCAMIFKRFTSASKKRNYFLFIPDCACRKRTADFI